MRVGHWMDWRGHSAQNAVVSILATHRLSTKEEKVLFSPCSPVTLGRHQSLTLGPYSSSTSVICETLCFPLSALCSRPALCFVTTICNGYSGDNGRNNGRSRPNQSNTPAYPPVAGGPDYPVSASSKILTAEGRQSQDGNVQRGRIKEGERAV
jgi:hypothetical protein